ncbi:LuxR family transcriptional regulator [Actinophytocola sp.]|uniref:LuxR family transcriptional regulator n=1 Tax=Actinophytocola sp. TaxID=1872138 RepID=UPI0025C60EB6|nr:LuxR family transcriptional regulator [Actinophytocola sp.]
MVRGYLLLPDARQHVLDGDHGTGMERAEHAAAIGHRFDDPDLVALARHIQARALIRLGRPHEGIALLDELHAGAVVAVTAGEVSAIVAGDIYCGVIEACQETFDLRRARVDHRAHPLVRRPARRRPLRRPLPGPPLRDHAAPRLLARGPRRRQARDPAVRVEPPRGRRGLLPGRRAAPAHRRADQGRGALPRQANRWGRHPQPGLALLRLAQDDPTTAHTSIHRALEDADDQATRCRLLPAYVEIAIAAGDPRGARDAADELAQHADALGAPLLHAAARHATGAVLLAEGHARDAATELRRAWARWQDLDIPYEAARARVLLGRACAALGDEDTARMERDAADWVLRQLGARQPGKGALTARETQVLRHVAAGRTNKAIAAELFLSEKTVARHVSNIFAKLGVSTRSAATAWAYEQHLV